MNAGVELDATVTDTGQSLHCSSINELIAEADVCNTDETQMPVTTMPSSHCGPSCHHPLIDGCDKIHDNGAFRECLQSADNSLEFSQTDSLTDTVTSPVREVLSTGESNVLPHADHRTLWNGCSVEHSSPLSRCDCVEEVLGNTDLSISPQETVKPDIEKYLGETDDDLLAELESEFSSEMGTVSDGQSDLARSVSVDSSASELTQLKRRQEALECRLENTLEAKRHLETENVRLEQKLQAAYSAVEAVQADVQTVTAEFELKVEQQTKELSELTERLKQQEESSQQALVELKAEHQMKIDQMSHVCTEYKHEKESIVMRYVEAEHRNNDLTERVQKAESKIRDWTKERDVALVKWKAMKEEKARLSDLCETKDSELTTLKRDLEKQKELVSSTDVKVKWNQNKLKAEQDAHKETKSKLEKVEKGTKESKKEVVLTWEHLRALYALFQNADSGTQTVANKLDDCKNSTADEVCSLIRKDIGTLSWKIKELMEELRTFKDKVRCLEVERLSQEDVLSSFRDNLQSQQTNNSDLRDRVVHLEHTEALLRETSSKLTSAAHRLEELEQTNSDLVAEMEKCSRREAEQLEFSSRVAEKNGCLQADNTRLTTQVESLSSELQSVTEQCSAVVQQKQKLEEELTSERRQAKEQIDSLEKKLTEEQQNAESTKQRVEDMEDEVKTLKRRHANNVKDLLRQLQLVTRRMENASTPVVNGGPPDSMSLGSFGSQGGSCGSLDTAGLPTTAVAEPAVREGSPPSLKGVHVVENRDALLEEVDGLRQTLLRKNEKIDFLKDHIDQLLEELHRKTRIIQGYVIRNEAGSLVPESSDRNKHHLARKGGIMASLYSSQSLDEGMTLNLSLEINHKLQALLEDSLLQNIKLKEGMDTLGKQIEWLTEENRRLKNEATSSVSGEQLADVSDAHS